MLLLLFVLPLLEAELTLELLYAFLVTDLFVTLHLLLSSGDEFSSSVEHSAIAEVSLLYLASLTFPKAPTYS